MFKTLGNIKISNMSIKKNRIEKEKRESTQSRMIFIINITNKMLLFRIY